jgi:DNA-directed RNA polymerase alpha subunit
MSDETFERKVTTPAEREARKAFRQVEAEKAMTDHERAQQALRENRERLKAERLAREAALKGKEMSDLDPTPELPDDTLIEMVRFPIIIRNGLSLAGLKTIGEIRAMSDGELRRIRRIGPGTLAFLRTSLGAEPVR